MIKNDCSSFIKISKCVFNENEKVYVFYNQDDKILLKTNDVYRIKEPTYDQNFKLLFSVSEKVKYFDCYARIKSLIASLLYPNETNDNISFQYLNNEKFVGDHKYIFDTIGKCEVKQSGEKKYFKEKIVLEMQRSRQTEYDLFTRFFKYGISLWINSSDNSERKTVLAFIDIPNIFEGCQSLKVHLENEKGELSLVDINLNIIFINLNDMSVKLTEGDEIKINYNNIKNTGKEWLKLLSVKHWALREDKTNLFIIPKNKDFIENKEVISAIEFLNCNNNDKKNAENKCEENENDKVKEIVIKNYFRIFEKGMDIKLDEEFDVEECFLKKIWDDKLEQKQKENSDKNFHEFSSFLQKKRIRIIAKRNEDEL